jgi:hypothetical protein
MRLTPSSEAGSFSDTEIISRQRNQHEADIFSCLLHLGFVLGLFFDAEDGGDMFLRNVG